MSAEKAAELALKKKHEQLHKANEHLRELSVTDALTGIINRRGFDERAAERIQHFDPLWLGALRAAARRR